MCSKCAPEGCSCTGGTASASCRCEEGEHCSACGHDPASQTDVLVVSDPDLAVGIVEFE